MQFTIVFTMLDRHDYVFAVPLTHAPTVEDTTLYPTLLRKFELYLRVEGSPLRTTLQHQES